MLVMANVLTAVMYSVPSSGWYGNCGVNAVRVAAPPRGTR